MKTSLILVFLALYSPKAQSKDCSPCDQTYYDQMYLMVLEENFRANQIKLWMLNKGINMDVPMLNFEAIRQLCNGQVSSYENSVHKNSTKTKGKLP